MKSQSLPRVLSPEDPQYRELPQAGGPSQAPSQRNNSSVPYGRYHSDWPIGERWSGQPHGQGPVALLPKPRFSRPVKPPSYETHQQNRGSWETLSSEPVSKSRDRSLCYSQNFEPLRDRSGCYSQSAEPLRDRSICFSQTAEPLRDRMLTHSQSAEPLRDRFISHSQSADLLRDRFITHSHSADLLRDRSLCYSQSSELLRDRSICYSQSAELLRPEAYRADLFYQELTGMEPPGYIPPPSYRRFPPSRGGQIFRADSALVRWKREPVSAEMGEWFSRTAGLSWSERREDRSMAVVPRRPVHPGPVVPNRPGHIQYVSFDDPRIRHISGGPGGNSLTDADKIRHVNKELPCAAALGQSTHDSAFLPAQGPSTDAHKPAPSEHENASRWHRGLNKGSESVAPDQSFSKFPTTFQTRPSQPVIKVDRSADQLVRVDRVPDQGQIKVDRVTEQVKVDRAAEQAKVEKITDPVKPVVDQVKIERITEIKPDRFTDKQIKMDRMIEQTKIERVPDQVKAERYTEKQIKVDVKVERIPDKQLKADRILDKPSKADTVPDKQVKVDKISDKIKPDKIVEKLTKSDKLTDKLLKLDKQTKLDLTIEQIKNEKSTDKQKKDKDKGSSESVSTAKTEPAQEPEKKSVKKKLSETIFCLVSVPLSQSSGKSRDQNNNEEKEPDSPPIPPPPPPSSSSENSNTLSSLPNQSLKSTSTTSTDLELQALTLGSASSTIITRRAHRRRNSRTRIIKPNPHDELRRYSGAWPGDQYRDQETQTSPELAKSAQHPGPDKIEAQPLPAVPEAEATAENGAGAPNATGAAGSAGATGAPGTTAVSGTIGPTGATGAAGAAGATGTTGATGAPGAADPGTPYGYPMKGQKSLKPSSNSAFSRTGTFKSTGSHRPPLHPPPHPPPPPPNQPPSQPPPPPPTQPPAKSPPLDQADDSKSAAGANPDNFGQYLLKPVSRRSWDAVEELESINKELQEQASKRPTVDQCIENLNEAYKDILELSTASNNLPNRSAMQIPDRIKARLSSDPLVMSATTLRPSLVPGSDPEYREVKSAFSRPSTGKSVSFSKQLREEICPAPPPSETGFRDYKTVMSQITHRKACRSVKLDLMIGRDSSIKDETLLALTASSASMGAEVPWADRQPMQDASTLTSPPDYEHICQTLQITRDCGAISRGASVKPKPGSAMITDAPQHVSMPGGSAVDLEQPCCSLTLDNSEKQARQEPVSLFREERSSGFRRVTSQSSTFVGNRSAMSGIATCKSIGDKAGLEANPEVPADWQMQLSLAEKHIATLITGEGSKQGSAENLDEKGKVERGAEGISASQLADDDSDKTGKEVNLVTCEGTDVPVEKQEDQLTQGVESQLPVERITADDSPEEQTGTDSEKCKEGDSATKDAEVQEQNLESVKEPSVTLRSNKASMWTHSVVDPGLLPEFPPDHLPLSVLAYPNRRLSLDCERGSWEGDWWNNGDGWARERRSLDAEREDLDGDRWVLDGDRQQPSGEKRGLGGWRGCGIDRQGADDSDWDLDVDKRHKDASDTGPDVDAEQKDLKQRQDQSEDQGCAASNRDTDGDKPKTPDKGQIRSAEVSPVVREVQGVSSLGRRGRGLSHRIEALHDRFIAPPGHGSEERLARMREVDTVSRMRRLSLRSTDSWDGLYGVSFVSRAEELGRDDEQSLPSTQGLPNATETVERENSAPCTDSNEPGETQDDQPVPTESQELNQAEKS
uniref:Junctional cadherin 5 associated a n=1 Tax=Astyanax mexicanus TaxID=7994 RepID=A0A8B9KX82_ASTMX